MGLKAGLSSGGVTLCQGNGWDPCLLLARITISNIAISYGIVVEVPSPYHVKKASKG